jgi:hypothetical protein
VKIDYIKTMTRVGELVRHTFHDKKLVIVKDKNLSNSLFKDNRGRVYAIVVDDEIHKIGGSQAKGGIKSTLDAYCGGFNYGMSARTYAVWNYLSQKLNAGKTIEIYCVWADLVEVDVPTMTGSVKQIIATDFHAIEKNFVDEYVKIEGKFPELNMQESGRKWEDTGLLEGWPGMGKRFVETIK